jgi:ABC-type sugar transport system ATPase subunit
MRSTKLTLIIGTNGTGKTTLLKKILATIPPHAKTLILMPDYTEWQNVSSEINLENKQEIATLEGRAKSALTNSQIKLIKNLQYFTQGTLIFDDCRGYLTKRENQHLNTLLIRRRQMQNDLFFVIHSFTHIPTNIYAYASDIFLFRTTERITQPVREKLIDANKMIEAQKRVNQAATQNPYFYERIKF